MLPSGQNGQQKHSANKHNSTFSSALDARIQMKQMTAFPQFNLDIRLKAHATFDTFYPGPNAELVSILRGINSNEKQILVWGNKESGKTHLAQALCHEYSQRHMTCAYVGCKDNLSPDNRILAGLDEVALICIDDIDCVLNIVDWDYAIFNLINETRNTNTRLFFTSSVSPQACQTSIRDLHSRLSWGPVYRLKALSDEDKANAIALHAKQRGLNLSASVQQFLFAHFPRDMAQQVELLEVLDKASLSTRRKITVPLIKETLSLVK